MLPHGIQKPYRAATRAKHCFLKPAKLANSQTFLYTCNRKYSHTMSTLGLYMVWVISLNKDWKSQIATSNF